MSKLQQFNDWRNYAFRLQILSQLGRSPRLFGRLAALGSSRATLVRPGIDLCVEAPPRSGNSFFVVGFQMANPGARLAHHHHVPAQVHNAVRLKVPVLTLLRNPIDSALAKAAPTEKRVLIGATLHRWIVFWSDLRGRLTDASTVSFEALIAEPSLVIRALNRKYSTSFSDAFPVQEHVFASIIESRIAELGPDAISTPSPNVPDERLALREAVLRPEAERHPLARPALDLYQEIWERLEDEGLSLNHQTT